MFLKKQFIVKLSFSISINKSRGQNIPNVGIYLSRHVFNHYQLYVALSICVPQTSKKFLLKNDTLKEKMKILQKNVVYK